MYFHIETTSWLFANPSYEIIDMGTCEYAEASIHANVTICPLTGVLYSRAEYIYTTLHIVCCHICVCYDRWIVTYCHFL